MTVRQLIEQLEKIEDKDKKVFYDYLHGLRCNRVVEPEKSIFFRNRQKRSTKHEVSSK